MQAGLLDTYRSSAKTRGPSAFVLAAVLGGVYLLLYFTDWLDRPARALGLEGKWTLYACAYSAAMVVGGLVFLRRHGRTSRYHRVRTWCLLAVQCLLAFALPLSMKVFTGREHYFSYFWPLKIEYLYPSYVLTQPFLILAWCFLGALLGVPLASFFLGKRFYCSWICGCGGLANTAGDPFRHLSSKSRLAWRVEQWMVHLVLALALGATAVVWVNWAIGERHPSFASFAFRVQELYGVWIGAVFAGVLGVGLYPLMGTRVWCRFGCPMAAVLGIVQRFGRFRVTVKPDMCIACGNCSTYCEMGIDVRAYAMANQDVVRNACVGCGMCAHVCPRGVLKLEATTAPKRVGADQSPWR